jgi:elongation factor 3
MSLLEPPADVLALLRDSLASGATVVIDESDDVSGQTEILAYVAFLAKGLADLNEYDTDVWRDVLSPYIQMMMTAMALAGGTNSSVSDQDDPDVLVEHFRVAAQREFTEEDDAESYGGDDDDAEEICNLRFNLAYGGKILLHGTKLRLLAGRRYALVGKNGVGKTTLMNAIRNGKLDGWPSHLVTAYVDSGSNVDPDYESQIVLEFLKKSTKRSQDDCIAALKELDFTEEMFQGSIGSLSGGWQMKSRLVNAGAYTSCALARLGRDRLDAFLMPCLTPSFLLTL